MADSHGQQGRLFRRQPSRKSIGTQKELYIAFRDMLKDVKTSEDLDKRLPMITLHAQASGEGKLDLFLTDDEGRRTLLHWIAQIAGQREFVPSLKAITTLYALGGNGLLSARNGVGETVGDMFARQLDKNPENADLQEICDFIRQKLDNAVTRDVTITPEDITKDLLAAKYDRALALLEASNIDVNYIDGQGRTFLSIVAMQDASTKNLECAKKLLDLGANIFPVSKAGEAIHIKEIAEESGNENVRVLLTRLQHTLIHNLVQASGTATARAFDYSREGLLGMYPHANTRYGYKQRTMLMIACSNSEVSLEVVNAILSTCPNVNLTLTDYKGRKATDTKFTKSSSKRNLLKIYATFKEDPKKFILTHALDLALTMRSEELEGEGHEIPVGLTDEERTHFIEQATALHLEGYPIQWQDLSWGDADLAIATMADAIKPLIDVRHQISEEEMRRLAEEFDQSKSGKKKKGFGGTVKKIGKSLFKSKSRGSLGAAQREIAITSPEDTEYNVLRGYEGILALLSPETVTSTADATEADVVAATGLDSRRSTIAEIQRTLSSAARSNSGAQDAALCAVFSVRRGSSSTDTTDPLSESAGMESWGSNNEGDEFKIETAELLPAAEFEAPMNAVTIPGDDALVSDPGAERTRDSKRLETAALGGLGESFAGFGGRGEALQAKARAAAAKVASRKPGGVDSSSPDTPADVSSFRRRATAVSDTTADAKPKPTRPKVAPRPATMLAQMAEREKAAGTEKTP